MDASYVYGQYAMPADRFSDKWAPLASIEDVSEFEPRGVTKLDVVRARAKQVGLVALMVITALALSPVLVPVLIGIGGLQAIRWSINKFSQENERLAQMRAAAAAVTESPFGYRYGY